MGYGDIPHIVRGKESHMKRIYHSNPDQALVKEVTLAAGYGVVKAGTPLAKVVGTGNSKALYIPYCMTVISSAVAGQGCAFIVSDQGASADIYVAMDDSYKFQVGDTIVIADNNTKTSSSEDLGVITAIDRTTYTHMAKITATSSASGATFTVAQSACIHLVAGADNSNTWCDAAGILDVSVDTGEGENAKGGFGTMVISNAILYYGMLTNIDAAAIADISGVQDGQYLIIK
jgi:hypothetical protein